LALAALLLLPAAAGGQIATGRAVPPKIYTHPSGAFALIPPQGTQVAVRQDGLAIAIRSPKGYMISIQGGDARPGVDLAARMADFETENVGPGKRWTEKLGSHEATVNGFPAFEALYRSETEAARATILRAGTKEYVFIYLTPPQLYNEQLGDYFAVMTSFRPTGVAIPESAAGESASAPRDEMPVAAEDTARVPDPAPPIRVRPSRREPAAGSGRVTMFADREFGLSVTYPEAWTADRASPHSVLFSGPEGSEAYYATVRLDRVTVPPGGDPRQSIADVVSDVRRQINAETRNPVFMIDRPYRHRHGGMASVGHEVLAAFTYRGQRFRRWLVVLPRPAAPEAYVWNFTAPDATFDRYREIAAGILDSLTVAAPETAATKF
jgi:hypothetical protein